jgi:hypothetical protein
MTVLLENVMAAKATVEAKYEAQTAAGSPLSPNQQAEILIAQVQAILAGEVLTIEPAAEDTHGTA